MTTCTLVAAALAAIILSAPAAMAGPPTDQLRNYTDAVISVLEDPALKAEGRRLERRAAVRQIAAEVLDINEMARRALGLHWQTRTAAEREEFVALFADLLGRTYMGRSDNFGGERIRFVGELVDGDAAIVRGRVITRAQKEVPWEARMVRRGDRWLVYDIAVENISLVANYRAQFDKIIRTSSYEDLVRRLRTKQDEFYDLLRPEIDRILLEPADPS